MSPRARAESARRISDCVTSLLRDQPFFGSLALRLPLRIDTSRKTLASDGSEIRYSPQWVADTDADLIKTALGRVVLGCALKHHTRRDTRDPERWQLASQFVTHGLLRDAGFTLPPDADAWDAMSVEQAYDRLPDPKDGDSGHNAAPQSGSTNTASDTARTQPGNDDDGASNVSANDKGQPEQDGSDTNTGNGRPPSFDPSGTGEIMDADARNDHGNDELENVPIDIAAEEQSWDEAMHQAMNLARAQGRAPSTVEETIRGAHRTVLDWRTLLRRYMTEAARRDYSWGLPNRRFIDGGLYLPSIRSEGIEAIAVIIDTSGSLPAQTLANFWPEVRELAIEIQPETVHVLQVDAAVQDAAEYAASDLPDEIVIKGRGGTDFRPGFAWLDEQGIQPDICIYLTDMGCSSYPETEPDYPVIWCNWGRAPNNRNQQPWGERIDINPT